MDSSVSGSAPAIAVILVIALCLIIGMHAPGRVTALPGTRHIQDDRGVIVSLPDHIDHVAPLFPPSIDEYLMITGRPRSVAVAQTFNRSSLREGLLGRVFPEARDTAFLNLGPGAPTSIETLLLRDLQIVFANPGTARVLERVGLPVVALDNPGDLQYALNTARLFSTSLGMRDPTGALLADYTHRLERLTQEIAALPQHHKPHVALIYFFQGRITAYGPRDFLAHFIELAGGTNAFPRSTRAAIPIDRERLVEASPDIIFVMTTASPQSAPQTVLNDPALALVPAVRNERVYRVMPGVEYFPMGLIGYPLYARWMAELINPGLTEELRREIRETYASHTGYWMTDADLDRSLAMEDNVAQSDYRRFAAHD